MNECLNSGAPKPCNNLLVHIKMSEKEDICVRRKAMFTAWFYYKTFLKWNEVALLMKRMAKIFCVMGGFYNMITARSVF